MAATAIANMPAVPQGATTGRCTVDTATINAPADAGSKTAAAGTIACSVTGLPYYVSSPSYVHVNVSWSCNAYYLSMAGIGNVLNKSKVFRDTKSRSGAVAHLEFSGVGGSPGTRAVWECPVNFSFAGVGILQVCTSISYI